MRLDAGLLRRRVVDRGDDLDEPLIGPFIIHHDLDAEAGEAAARLFLHAREVFSGHIARMRIKLGEHAVDRAFDELGVFRLLDVILVNLLENLAEEVELAEGVGRNRRPGEAR